MIGFKNMMVAIAVLVAFTACGGDKDEKPLDITGEWNLVDVRTKSATLGDQTVDVYLSFSGDKTFTMYQMIGTGRYRKYSGTWNLTGATLAGQYSDGKQWGTSYEVELSSSDTRMTLTSAAGEVDTYQKTAIPTGVVDDAIPVN